MKSVSLPHFPSLKRIAANTFSDLNPMILYIFSGLRFTKRFGNCALISVADAHVFICIFEIF